MTIGYARCSTAGQDLDLQFGALWETWLDTTIPKTGEKKIQQALAMYDAKDIPIKDILEATGISRATLYSYLDKRRAH